MSRHNNDNIQVRAGKRATHLTTRYRGMSLLGLVLLIVFLLICFIAFQGPIRRRIAKKKSLPYRMEKLYQTLTAYTDNHSGRLPCSEIWCDELLQQDKNLDRDIFRRGNNNSEHASHMAFNSNVSQVVLSELAPNTVLLFALEGQWNLAGAENLVPANKTVTYLLANGKIIRCWRVNDVYETSGVVGENLVDLNWHEAVVQENGQGETPSRPTE